MASSNLDEDLTPIKESSHFKLSPEEIFYLKQLDPNELREKFIKVNEDFMTLKIFTRKQEDKITRLQTKLRKLTSDLKGRHIGEKGESFRLLIIEHEEKVQLLNTKISQLQSRNKNLEAKLQVANVQLCAARKNKVPMLYRHVTPRIDSGIKRSRISKSLTNIHQATENFSRIAKPVIRRSNSKNNDYASHERDSSNLSTPREEHDSLEMSNQVRFILEEARKRILDLEEDQEQLLQQLSEAQQNSEIQEREMVDKISSLEKELERKSGECRERELQEQKERMTFIRAERQSKASSARMNALSNHLKEMENKLKEEREQKEEALDALDMLKEEKQEKENQLKEIRFQNQKLEDKIQEIKTDDSYLKKQLKQLETENQRLTELCVLDRKTSKRREETYENNKSSYNVNLIQREKDKRSSSENSVKENYSKHSIDSMTETMTNRLTDLMTEISREKEEKTLLVKEISREKENYLKALVEIEDLKVLNKKLSEKTSLEKNTLVNEESLVDLKKSIEEYKQIDKGNIYDKMAFRELQNQYTELQLIYRQKKIELDKANALLSGHADTYKHLQNEKENLRSEIKKQSEVEYQKIINLESSLKTKNDVISRLEKQVLRLQQPPSGDDVTKEEVSLETGETLSLHKHHNILELVIDKLKFSVPVDDKSKIFASWVMFVPLREPLQHTSVARGSPALFSHTSLYKFKMNYSNFFLIRDEVLKVHIYFLLENNLPLKIGECVISLEELLMHPQNSLHGTVIVDKFVEDGQDMFKDLTQSGGQDGNTIGSLFYSIRFHKSGEEYLSKFRKKIAELKRSEELRRKVDTVSSSSHPHFTSNSTNSSPKSSVPPFKNLQEQNTTNQEESSGEKDPSEEMNQKLNQLLDDAHENISQKVPSSSSSSSSSGNIIPDNEDGSNGTKSSRRYSDCGKNSWRENSRRESSRQESSGQESTRQKKSRQENSRQESSGREKSRQGSSGREKSRQESSSSTKSSAVLSSTSMSTDKENSTKSKTEEIENEDEKREDDKQEEITNERKDADEKMDEIQKQRKRPITLSKQLMSVFRAKKLLKGKLRETNEETGQPVKEGSKRKKLGLLQKSKTLFSSSAPSMGSDAEDKEVTETTHEEEIKEMEKNVNKDHDSDVDDGSDKEDKDSDYDKEDDSDNHNEDEESDRESISVSSDNDSKTSSKAEEDRASSNLLLKKKMEVEKTSSQKSHSEETDSDSDSSHSNRRDSEEASSRSRRKSSSSSGESSSGSSTSKNDSENGILHIEIVGLELERNARLIQDSSVEYLVVDYFGFLDLEPESMETPKPMPKPKPGVKMYFNFVNDIKLSKRGSLMLEKLQKQDAEIKFHLSSEPQNDMHQDEDLELGFATLKIRKMLKGFKGGIPILDLDNSAKIGSLFVETSFDEL